jgi:hypothetical protein
VLERKHEEEDVSSAKPAVARPAAAPSVAMMRSLQQGVGNAVIARAMAPASAAGMTAPQTTMQRHSIQAEIRRGRNPAAQAIEGLAGGRLDAPRGHEHGGEEHKPLIEAAAKVEAPAGAAAPEAEAEAPEAQGEEGAPEEKEIKLPDIEVPALAEIGKSDSIFTWFGYTTSKERGGAQPTGFGVTRSFSSKLTGVTIVPLPWSYMVSATLEHPVTWQVRSGTGPDGQVNVLSAASSNITAANYAAVADDLTPDMSDLNGRPPRAGYWAEDLTIRHELVHVADDQGNGPTVTTQVSNWLKTQTAGDRAGVEALLAAIPGRFAAGLMAALTTEAGEIHAYGDGAPSYKARADLIRERGAAGEYA